MQNVTCFVITILQKKPFIISSQRIKHLLK